MTLSTLTLIFEAGVSLLLIAVIFYAIKLNRRLGGLREREAELQELITRFNDASGRAEASAATLKTIGIETEKSLGVMFERAQAVRDDLAFMVDRGNGLADRVERSIDRTRPVARREDPKPAEQPDRQPTLAERLTPPRPSLWLATDEESGEPGDDTALPPAPDEAPSASGHPKPWTPPSAPAEIRRASAPPAPVTEESPRSEAERELLRALRSSGMRR